MESNRGKSDIYRQVNKVNGNTYISSSVNLVNRMSQYYSYSYLTHPSRDSSLINRALLKFGYSSFSLEILEYCDQSDLLKREQYYFNSLKPEYNILNTAGSWLGMKYSEDSKLKISESLKGKIKSLESCQKLSDSQIGINNSFFDQNHSEFTKLKMSQAKGTTIYVYTLDLQLLETFPSSKAASNKFNTNTNTIMRYA